MIDAPILHTLTIHPPEDGELRYTLTCPAGNGPDRVCTLFEQCGCTPIDPDDPCCDDRPCPASPAGHRWMPAPNYLAYPTTKCWVRDGDNTGDAVLDMGLPPGIYQVQWEPDGDEGEYITLTVVTEVSA